MIEKISEKEVEIASQNIIDAITTIDHLPTDDHIAFHKGFYDGEDVAADMYTLVQAFGRDLPNKGKDKVLFKDRTRTLVQTRPLGGRCIFRALATTRRNDDDYEYHDVQLQASTKVSPFLTRKRTIWGLRLAIRDVSQPSSTPYEDEAYAIQYKIGKQTIGLEAPLSLSRNRERINPDIWYPENQHQEITRTTKDIPILPSAKTNRRLQLFIDNFCSLNLFFLSSTTTPISIRFF